jgi:hypothetical protein
MVNKYKAPLFHRDNSAMALGQAIHTGFAMQYLGKDYEVELRKAEAIGQYDSDIVNHAICLLDGRQFAEEQGIVPKLDKIIAIEKELSCTIGNNTYLGKLDAIAEYNGKLWIVEHKSSGFFLKQPEKYEKAIQSNLYCHLARINSYNVAGILVNYIKTIGLQQRTKKKPETKDEYWERAFNDVIDKIDSYYTFLEVPRIVEQVATIINDITEITSHINYCRIRNCFHRSPDSCNEYRRWCEYNELCTGRYNENEIAKRTIPHTEYSQEFLRSIGAIKTEKQKLKAEFNQLF